MQPGCATGLAGRAWTPLIIDSEGPVEPGRIRDAVDSFVNAPVSYEQLLVYFAGHGVNLRYSEYWLLSKAPKDTQAAVNVLGSATLARYCGIGHVVFISDACRTAADSVRAQFVTGSKSFRTRAGPTRNSRSTCSMPARWAGQRTKCAAPRMRPASFPPCIPLHC